MERVRPIASLAARASDCDCERAREGTGICDVVATYPVGWTTTTFALDDARVPYVVTTRDKQDKVKIRIFQGEGRKEEECQLLGEFEFGGLPQKARGLVKM